MFSIDTKYSSCTLNSLWYDYKGHDRKTNYILHCLKKPIYINKNGKYYIWKDYERCFFFIEIPWLDSLYENNESRQTMLKMSGDPGIYFSLKEAKDANVCFEIDLNGICIV